MRSTQQQLNQELAPFPAPALRVAEDLLAQPDIDVELLMSTHLTMVVRARVEFADSELPQDTGIVISRRRCEGGPPSGRVLAEAARECAVRLALRAGSVPRAVKRLCVRVGGSWQALLDDGARPPRLAS